MKLNVGCGRNHLDGWVNIDHAALPGVDIVAELDDRDKVSLPFPDESGDEFLLSHVIEHIRYPLPLMQELWRVAKPGARMTIVCPYGSSDDADEDPTHVRRMFLNSFAYFGQPFYYRADYGYRGDWDLDHLVLDLPARYADTDDTDAMLDVMILRNVVDQITAHLVAVKPARSPDQALIRPPGVRLRVVR